MFLNIENDIISQESAQKSKSFRVTLLLKNKPKEGEQVLETKAFIVLMYFCNICGLYERIDINERKFA